MSSWRKWRRNDEGQTEEDNMPRGDLCQSVHSLVSLCAQQSQHSTAGVHTQLRHLGSWSHTLGCTAASDRMVQSEEPCPVEHLHHNAQELVELLIVTCSRRHMR
mmetsp:Transcript_7102/g.12183  ORF Transcript_7102/g.12183 Transcript_7102/m.12183 type:complete len:104 (+) Transcript_7102:931-1242(+)